MAKRIKQFRYYSDGSDNNYPNSIEMTKTNLISGKTFENYNSILQLGIQSLPGTEFYLNNTNYPVIIGSTGIYELDLDNLMLITNLRFAPQSLELIDKNNNAYLIIDMIYEDGEK